MLLGKPRPKMSFSTRRIRLGVAHHGAPSGWVAPSKDATPERGTKQPKKGRRS